MTKTRSSTVVTVVVSTDDGRWLERCLTAATGVEDASVIVVLNDCHDESEAIASEHGCVTIHSGRRLGFAEANNLALGSSAVAEAEFVFLLNPDTILHPRALARLTGVLEAFPSYGIVGAWQIEYDDETWGVPNGWTDEVVREAAALGQQVRDQEGHRLLDHYYVQGAALMARTSVLDRIGLFEPHFGTFYEETELCRRARLAGYGVAIVCDALVRHAGGGTWRSSPDLHAERDRLMLRNQLVFEWSGAPGWQLPATTLRTVASQVASLRRGDRHLLSGLRSYPGILVGAVRMMPVVRRLRAHNRRITRVAR